MTRQQFKYADTVAATGSIGEAIGGERFVLGDSLVNRVDAGGAQSSATATEAQGRVFPVRRQRICK